jgi:CRISPR/Cas system CSM-associated protein Csm2 small subunit
VGAPGRGGGYEHEPNPILHELESCTSEDKASELGEKMAIANPKLSSGKLREAYLLAKEARKRDKKALIRLRAMIAYKKDHYNRENKGLAKSLVDLIKKVMDGSCSLSAENLFVFFESWLCYSKLYGREDRN